VLLQVIVETLFWFHPVVWWIGARLVSERERACDEEVVRMGADTRNYAESILKVCGFSLGSPIECRVGVGRSGLAQRIVRIMQQRPTPGLSTSTRALLSSVGVMVVAAPLMTGVLDARRPSPGPLDPGTNASPSLQAAPGAGGQPTVYRVGRDIKSPKLVKEAKPGYTPAALKARIQGLVRLEAVVLTDGTVGDVKVTKSLDRVHGLDNEAVKTVKKWRFEPGTKDGKPVAVALEIEMTFTFR
jgi:TonB family protein